LAPTVEPPEEVEVELAPEYVPPSASVSTSDAPVQGSYRVVCDGINYMVGSEERRAEKDAVVTDPLPQWLVDQGYVVKEGE